jgi:hypothetical protein
MEDEEKVKKVEFRVISEILGHPKEHVDTTLKIYIEAIKKNNAYKILDEQLFDAEKQEKTGMYSGFVDLRIETKSFNEVVGFCFDYMPSSVEIIEPNEITMKNRELSGFLNELQAKLHNIEMNLKNLSAEKDILHKKFVQLIRYVLLYHVQEKAMDVSELAKATGVGDEVIVKYLDVLVKKGELKKEKDKYLPAKKFDFKNE